MGQSEYGTKSIDREYRIEKEKQIGYILIGLI